MLLRDEGAEATGPACEFEDAHTGTEVIESLLIQEVAGIEGYVGTQRSKQIRFRQILEQVVDRILPILPNYGRVRHQVGIAPGAFRSHMALDTCRNGLTRNAEQKAQVQQMLPQRETWSSRFVSS